MQTKYLLVLFGVMILDYFMYFAISLLEGRLVSELGLKGLMKKFGILACILLASLIDILNLYGESQLQPIVVLAFIGTEGFDIIKVAKKLKVPIPSDLARRLQSFNNKK